MAAPATRVKHPVEPPPAPPRRAGTWRAWARENLFSNWVNSVLTVLFAALLAYAGFRAARFVFVSGRWEIIRVNLRLFMVGRFPADELWRLWAAAYIGAAAAGLLSGVRAVRARALEGEPADERGGWRARLAALRPAGPALLGLVAVLSLTQTPTPTALTVIALVMFGVFRLLGGQTRVRRPDNTPVRLVLAAYAAVLGARAAAGILGRDGLADLADLGVFWGLIGAVAPVLLVVGLLQARPGLVGAAGLVWAYTVIVAFDGVPVARFGGFLLTLFAASAGIVLSFPFGLLLALGRRSSFPAFRLVSVVLIEVIRGVPLISLLFMGFLAFGFFLPEGMDTPSIIGRSIVMIMLFSAAYVAEIVRGGLQSVPAGQVEAGQSVGLSPLKVTRLIVLPQALRNVIPALVGQFISLFKDTSLLTIIGVTELLGYADVVRQQPNFLGQQVQAETLAFVAFIYWVCTYSMSRYSQRLETRLGVGTR